MIRKLKGYFVVLGYGGYVVLIVHIVSSDLVWQPLWDTAYSPLAVGMLMLMHAEWLARRTDQIRRKREESE